MAESEESSKPRVPDAIAARDLPRGEQLRVYVDQYRGRHSLHIRRWWTNDAGELRPGKGATIPAHLIPWLRVAIEKAEAEALGRALLSEEDYELAGLALPVALGG